jgi:CRISPR-associated protein Csb1
MTQEIKEITLQDIRAALEGSAAAFRAVTDLLPVGGDGDKVFPATYEGSVYAEETRIINGQPERCVLLDSVQSQANRLELALLEGHRSEKLKFPFVEVDFAGTSAAEVGKVTALEAPHRVFDALFLACEVESEEHQGKRVPFRPRKAGQAASQHGKRLEQSSAANATSLFELCPTALLFGAWDSHGARGGLLGEKVQRALVSEIIGIGFEAGKRPVSRLDPVIRTTKDLPIEELADGSWKLAAEGATNTKKLAKVGLGNVTPSLVNPETKTLNHGGVTLRLARQITVLSLPALRRLRFPVSDDKKSEQEKSGSEEVKREMQQARDLAAQTVLCALGLAALAWQWRVGFSLRSRCDLFPQRDALLVEQIGGPKKGPFSLTHTAAAKLLGEAATTLGAAGLQWNATPVALKPSSELAKVVQRSRELAAEGN